MSPTIEVDIKELFDKLDRKLDNISTRFEQKLDAVNSRLDTISKDVVDLKVGQARLEEKVDGLGKRLDNQEFISRGVLIGFFVAVLVGLAKMFGFVGNP